MKIRTNADVRAEVARAGLKMQDVSRAMGKQPSEFSRETHDLNGRPSPEWVKRFTDAMGTLTAGVPR